MRSFIAIDLDKEIKKTLIVLIEKLAREKQNIKWVRQTGMHLTLKFLGEIKEEKISEIENISRNVTRNYRPFSLKIKSTGYFPHEKRNPRVLWTGIEADESLISLQKQLEEELEKIGFPREKRKFHPHLTLGRVKSTSFLQETIQELEKYKESVFGEMTVRKIIFFQSILKYSGAEYKIISEFLLK